MCHKGKNLNIIYNTIYTKLGDVAEVYFCDLEVEHSEKKEVRTTISQKRATSKNQVIYEAET